MTSKKLMSRVTEGLRAEKGCLSEKGYNDEYRISAPKAERITTGRALCVF